MTAQLHSREQLLETIVALEKRMFMAVKASSPSACQQHLHTFSTMRLMSHCVLSDETLLSYLRDLRDAYELEETEGCCVIPGLSELNAPNKTGLRRNFFTEKYARIEGIIPPLKESHVIDEIVEIESIWFRDLQSRFPRVFQATGAFERYEHAELETYSDRTLALYARDLRAAREQGRNLVEERYRIFYRALGFGTLTEPLNFLVDLLKGELNVR